MANEYAPEEQHSPAPERQPDPGEAVLPTLTAEEADEGARRRASAAKEFQMAEEEEVERSSQEGGPPSDVAPTSVAPPTD